MPSTISAARPVPVISPDNMALRPITEYPEPVLAEVGKPVIEFDAALSALCDDMYETMYDAEGVGLAAPQIGLKSVRLFVMDCDGVKLVAANPEIVHTEGKQSGQEGCLSVGKFPAVVVRPLKARLKAQNLDGKWFEKDAEGYAARCFLHRAPITATERFSLTACRKCGDRCSFANF